MWRALVRAAGQVCDDLKRSWYRRRRAAPRQRVAAPSVVRQYLPLERVILTDGVGRTLFEEYAAHRAEARGEEEIGWVLLGLREESTAVVLATLPAGAERDASVAHVRFNSGGQVVGSLIVRQADRRLRPLGVVHTHPGSLRHPSDADFRGDSQWIRVLRGQEGIFGIGTADGKDDAEALFAQQPKPHVQMMGELRLSWYALRHGDANYRPVPVELTLGPDLARPLHQIWSAIEAHAERLERLYCQQAKLTFDVVEGSHGPRLAMDVPLSEPGTAIRVLLTEKEVRYYLARGGEMLSAGFTEDRVDRGVYLLLAELAAQVS